MTNIVLKGIFFREKEALAKGEIQTEDGKIPSEVKKKQIQKRIQEWERFEANCLMLKELEREKKKLKKQLERKKRRKSLGNSSKVKAWGNQNL